MNKIDNLLPIDRLRMGELIILVIRLVLTLAINIISEAVILFWMKWGDFSRSLRASAIANLTSAMLSASFLVILLFIFLKQAGKQVLEVLDERVTLANFRPDADSQQPEVQILPDWERAAEFGLSVDEIGEAIQTAIEGNVTTQLQRRDRLVDIRVELPNATIENSAQLAQLPLLVGDGRSVRLRDVAQIKIGQAPGEI